MYSKHNIGILDVQGLTEAIPEAKMGEFTARMIHNFLRWDFKYILEPWFDDDQMVFAVHALEEGSNNDEDV